MTNNDSRRHAKRQVRGLQRVDIIFNAAAEVFVEVGYVGATMGMIANRADMASGSLYQFFPNKEAIASALANNYIEQFQVIYEQILALNFSHMDLAAIIDNFIDPLVKFNRKNPAFYVLSVSTQYLPQLEPVLKDFHEAVIQYIRTVITHGVPTASIEEQSRAAVIMRRMFLAILPLLLNENETENALVLDDMKAMFVFYLSRLA